MPIPREPASKIFDFVVADFESAWDALVARKGRHSGGNFMFALQSMIFLEFACRVCYKDPAKEKLPALAEALKKIEPRYFTPLPGPCEKPSEFALPGDQPQNHVLAMMFDLIRNGKAHQYQSPTVTLSDGEVDIDLTGATSGRGLTKPGRRRPRKHLCYKVSSSGDLSLYVRTDQLFLDIKKAIETSNIISHSDLVSDVARPRQRKKSVKGPSSQCYDFTVADLESSLEAGHYVKGRW